MTALILRSTERSHEEVDGRWPEQARRKRLRTAFERFGLSERLK